MKHYTFLLRVIPPLLAGLFFVLFWKIMVDGAHLQGWRCSSSEQGAACLAATWKAASAAEKKVENAQSGSVSPFTEVPPIFDQPPPANVGAPAAETAARSLWATTFAVAVVAAAMAWLYCLHVFWRQIYVASEKPGQKAAGIWLVAILVLMAPVGVLMEHSLGWFGNPIFDTLGRSTLVFVWASPLALDLKLGPSAYDVVTAIKPLYGLVVIWTVSGIVAGAASLTTCVQPALTAVPSGPPKDMDAGRIKAAREIAVRMGILNRMLYISSAALVLAVIAVRALVNWPASLAKAPLQADMIALGQAALINWGASMSLLLVVTYATTAFWLDRAADRVLTADTEPKRINQRQEHGMTLNLRVETGKVLVAALPLLTSSAGPIISAFAGSIQ